MMLTTSADLGAAWAVLRDVTDWPRLKAASEAAAHG